MMDISGLIGADLPLAPVSADNVTNHWALPGDGMIRNYLYSNTTGLPAAAQAFLCSGLMPITAAMVSNGISLSIQGAAPNWQFNGARINFYGGPTASGNFISSVTTGVTQSSDARTLACVPGSIPSTATHYATNLKWTQGIPTLVYAGTNVIPTGAETALAAAMMSNSGTTAACLTVPGAAGTSESVTAAPVLSTGQFLVCQQGYSTFTRKPWQAGKHIVRWDAFSPESHDYNNALQFNSVVYVADTLPAPQTPGGWSAGFSSSGASANTYAVWSDTHPAYKINGMFLAGNHGIVSSFITMTAHGKTNVDRGSTWNLSGVQYMLTGVYDANHLVLTALNTGTATHWAINSATITTGTLTHVSGATNTADIVVASGVLAYPDPAVQVLKNKVWLDGARVLDTAGAYVASLRIQDFSVRLPNAAAVLDYVAANVGSSGDLNYNDPSIQMQVQIDGRWIDDAWSQTVFHQVTALQDYLCSFSWPMQWQQINARSSASETLWHIVPGTVTNAAAVTSVPGDHSNGSPLNFDQWQNISANAKEYYFDPSVWAAGSFWADGVQRPAWVAAFGVKDGSGNWLRKFCMARSRVVGWTADGIPAISHFLSSANKAYAVTRYNEEVLASDARMCVAGSAWTDPAFDTNADISFAFPLNGGQYEWNWWAAGAVTDYVVPIPAGMSGKKLKEICASAGCTLTIISETIASVSTTGQGEGFVAVGF